MTDAPINDTRKAELLSKTVEHIDIKSFDARPIVDAMKKMSFTSRDLGRAADIYNQMLADKDCSIILVIAGSTSAGGCMDLYAELVANNMVDAVVATGHEEHHSVGPVNRGQALKVPPRSLKSRNLTGG